MEGTDMTGLRLEPLYPKAVGGEPVLWLDTEGLPRDAKGNRIALDAESAREQLGLNGDLILFGGVPVPLFITLPTDTVVRLEPRR